MPKTVEARKRRPISLRPLLASTALSHASFAAIPKQLGFAAALLVLVSVGSQGAHAQAVGGAGGAGSAGFGGAPGPGGTGASPNGTSGTGGVFGGGGGGGAGVSTLTGAGGTSGSGGDNGGGLNDTAGGNGGELGSYNQVNPGAIASGTGTGGTAGDSATNATVFGGGGGGGGAGGGGVLSSGGNFTISGATTVRGGNGGGGGNGGDGVGNTGGNGGGGGGGGSGIDFTGAALVTNNGNIIGGNGGAGGSGGTGNGTPSKNGTTGAVGAGGAGITGANLTINNSGTISGGLAGDNTTRANAITFTGGSNFLNLNPTGAQGTLTGNIDVTGTLTFNQANAATLGSSNLITGSGAIIQAGTGTLTLNGANTYSGGTTISTGTIQVGNDAALGTGALTLNGGTLQAGTGVTLGNAIRLGTGGGTIDAATNAVAISGNITDGAAAPGPLTIKSTGGIAGIGFFGSNTYSGATIVASTGVLDAFSATALSPNSDFTVNGLLALVGFNNTIRSLSGTGGVNNAAGAATLTIALPTGTATFGGTLFDGGGGSLSLVKTGAGVQVLTGASTYTGSTTVNGGTLEVDGSIATSSLTTVNSGATLSGTGTIGLTTITGGGILAPGNASNPTGILAVTGNLAFQSGAVYLVQVTPSAAARTNVSGTAALGGTVQAVFAPGSYVARQYDILHSTGLGGTAFSGLTTANQPGFNASLSYSATDVFLNLTAMLGSGGGFNQNQQNVANAINGFFNNGGALPPAFQALFNLTGSNLGNALTQASGEIGTGSQQTTFNAMGQFMGLLTDPFMGRGNGVNGASATPYADESASSYAARRRNDAFAMFTKAPPAPFVPSWSVWAAGFGGSQSTDGNAVVGSNNTTSSIFGTAVGADYLFSPDTLAGFALAGGGTNFSVNGLGSGRSDLFQAGAYVRHTAGAAYITGALAYGWQDITTNRTVMIAGLDQLRAEFNANAYSGRVEGGYRFVAPVVGGVGITPYAAGQFTTFDLPAYAESVVTGASNFALNYTAKSVTDTRSELGIRTDKSFAVQDGNGILTLRGRLAWAHDFDPDRSLAATFQTLPGASFVVNGAAQAADSALTTASAEMKWINGWSAAATFEGEFSNVTRSYAGKGVVRYAW